MEKVQLYLTERTLEVLREESSRLGISLSELVRRYLDKVMNPLINGKEHGGE